MSVSLRIVFGMVIGCLLTTLIVYFFKPAFLSSSNSLATSHTDDQLSYEEYEIDPDDEANLCQEPCINRIINQLVTGTNLSDEQGVGTIPAAYAKKVAKRIQSQPETLKEIIESFNSIKKLSDQRPFILTFNFLPIEQQEKIISRFIKSENPERRSLILDLIYYAGDSSDKNLAILQNVVANETNEKVLLEAIEILHGAYSDHDQKLSRSKLNQVLASKADDQFRELALVIKSRMFEINEEVKQDILTILNSGEGQIRETTVRVLDDVFNRQSRGEEQSDWRNDKTLRSVIEAIANDVEEETIIRMEALGVMSRHYSK